MRRDLESGPAYHALEGVFFARLPCLTMFLFAHNSIAAPSAVHIRVFLHPFMFAPWPYWAPCQKYAGVRRVAQGRLSCFYRFIFSLIMMFSFLTSPRTPVKKLSEILESREKVGEKSTA